jgi:hypothetical protein
VPRLIVYITPEYGEKLRAVATAERRRPNDQAALYIERALAQPQQAERKTAVPAGTATT